MDVQPPIKFNIHTNFLDESLYAVIDISVREAADKCSKYNWGLIIWNLFKECGWCGLGFLPGETVWVSHYYLCSNIHGLRTTEISCQLFKRPVCYSAGIFHWWAGRGGGVRDGAGGWGTARQTGRSRVRLPMESLEFFSDLILPVACWPRSRLSL
jgi:hypothetical protein